MKTPLNILKQYWGFDSFRPKQLSIIESILDGQDTFALLPTGGGKSVCFQVPALVKDGICIVVSPLVALMNDQVEALQQKGIKALALTGGMSYKDVNIALDNATYGNYKFLYISPERLQQELVQNCIKRMPVSIIAIDEAHCISQWGNDFRPAYKNITFLREIHPLVPIIALTATATPQVLEDTIEELKMELPRVVKKSFTRDNLAYRVIKEEDKLYRISQLLKNLKGNAIIYVRNRKGTVETSQHLNAMGIKSSFYHGGISKTEKSNHVAQWKSGATPVMVATNAFGMGIDHPDVRFVIHTQLPESIESYFQEAGRAGRDGAYAEAVVIYSDYDKKLVIRQFVDSLATVPDLKLVYKKLSNYFQVSYGEGAFEKQSFNFTQFCKTYDFNTLRTYNGLQTLDRLGIIQLSREFGQKSIIHFTCSSQTALDYFAGNPLASVIGKTILRIYGGVFELPTNINLDLIQSKTGQAIPVLIKVLEKMKSDGLLTLNLQTTDASITFLVPREDDRTINVIAKEVVTLNDKKKQQVQHVINYVDNSTTCKSVQLVSYFGEEDATPCGICSVCTAQNVKPNDGNVIDISSQIKIRLEDGGKTSRELTESLTFAEPDILNTLRKMMDANIIGVNMRNRYYLL